MDDVTAGASNPANQQRRALAAAVAALIFAGCASTPASPSGRLPPSSDASRPWVSATVSYGGDCGLPVLRFAALPGQAALPHGANAIDLPRRFWPPDARPRAVEVVLGDLDPNDPRRMVNCHALGPERAWVLVDAARWPDDAGSSEAP